MQEEIAGEEDDLHEVGLDQVFTAAEVIGVLGPVLSSSILQATATMPPMFVLPMPLQHLKSFTWHPLLPGYTPLPHKVASSGDTELASLKDP